MLKFRELELATIIAALEFFRETKTAEDDGRTPAQRWEFVDESIGALTPDEISELLIRLRAEFRAALGT